MSESTAPCFVYKLVPESAPIPLDHSQLPERLPVSAIDQASGFIHLSTAAQVLNTLKWFFADDLLVYALQVDYSSVEGEIRWEDPKAEVCGPRGGEGMFPHLYNGLKLGRDEVVRVEVLRNGDGGWEAAVAAAGGSWLVQ